MEISARLILTIKSKLTAGHSPYQLAVDYDLPVDVILALSDRKIRPRDQEVFTNVQMFQELLADPLIKQARNGFMRSRKNQMNGVDDSDSKRIIKELKKKKRELRHMKILFANEALARRMKRNFDR